MQQKQLKVKTMVVAPCDQNKPKSKNALNEDDP